MAALPSVSGERAARVFQKAGWVKDRQRGSHVILIMPETRGEPIGAATSRNRSGDAAGVDPLPRESRWTNSLL